MLLFDLGVQLTVGTVLAMSDRENLIKPDRSPYTSPVFRNGLLYSMLIYIPSALYFLYAWPGWNTMYMIDAETNRLYGSWFLLLDTWGLTGCYVLGFWATTRALRSSGGKTKPLVMALGGLWLAISVLLFVVMWGRSFAVTTYDAFHAGEWARFDLRWGEPDSFFGRPIMWYLLVFALPDVLPVAWLYRRRRRQLAAG